MADPNRTRQPEVLRRVLDGRVLDIHTGLPGNVRRYDPATQTAEIQLGVHRVIPAGDEDEDDTVEEYPILADVPVAFPRGGGFRITWPLAEGDSVWVMFSEADINAWRASGAVSDPGVATRHGLSGGVAYPGLHHQRNAAQNATSNTLRIEYEGGAVLEVTGGEIRAGGTAALAEGADVRAHLQAIAAALDTLAGLLSTTSSYVYATVIGTNPIDTTITKGT